MQILTVETPTLGNRAMLRQESGAVAGDSHDVRSIRIRDA